MSLGAVQFQAYHTVLKTQPDFIAALKVGGVVDDDAALMVLY